jgi:hypothetical protein
VARLVLPFACQALTAEPPGVRVTAAHVIALLAIDADSVLPQLVRAIVDADVAVRIAALDALGEFGDQAMPYTALIAERCAAASTEEERVAAASLLENLTGAAAP